MNEEPMSKAMQQCVKRLKDVYGHHMSEHMIEEATQ